MDICKIDAFVRLFVNKFEQTNIRQDDFEENLINSNITNK